MTTEARADLINAITVISGYAQLMANGTELTPSEVKRWGVIIKFHIEQIHEGLKGDER